VIQVYTAPPSATRVICIDEFGPIAVNTDPGAEWTARPGRARYEPDDGRRVPRGGSAAFEPATGQA
jgi:hypothetical protein